MKKQNRGVTLIEMVVYFALATLAGVLLWGFQSVARTTHTTASASYLVSGETETCTQWIRKDINETALASVQVYGEDGEEPGMSFVSNRAYDPDQNGKMLVNSWGAPQWDKHVLYSLDVEPGERTGNLVRWEREIANKNLLPVLCDLLPNSATRQNHRVVLRDVLAPNQTVQNVGPEGGIASDDFGGFRAQFIRRQNGSDGEESLTSDNPTLGDPRHNTRMMEFELKILQDERSTPNYFEVRFRAAAMH